METWEHGKMEVVYCEPATNPPEHYPCDVRFDDAGGIVVNYQDWDGRTEYQGKDLGGGHFEVHCTNRPGHAMLHRARDSRVLIGYWQEGGDRGFSRIQLVGAPRGTNVSIKPSVG